MGKDGQLRTHTTYAEVEQTGANSQFYDKFNIRYNISHIMKTIWAHPAHRAKVREQSKYVHLQVEFDDYTR